MTSGTRFWPKEIVSLLMIPPQTRQGGSSSPARTRSSVSAIGRRSPQSQQRVNQIVPWTSTTDSGRLPAIWWSPSTFWVTTARRLPADSSWAIARWPSLGIAAHAGESRRVCHARTRTSGSAR